MKLLLLLLVTVAIAACCIVPVAPSPLGKAADTAHDATRGAGVEDNVTAPLILVAFALLVGGAVACVGWR